MENEIQRWHRRMIVRHGFAFCCEVAFVLAFCYLLLKLYQTEFQIEKAITKPLLAIWFSYVIASRAITTWNLTSLWKVLENKFSTPARTVDQLIHQKGHIPNSEFQNLALQQFAEYKKQPYPWTQAISRTYNLWPYLILGPILILSFDQFRPSIQQRQGRTAFIQAPDYLKLPQRKLHPKEEHLKLYPGTLITFQIPKTKQSLQLTSLEGHQYFPTRESDDKIEYEFRIFSPTSIYLNHQRLWKIDTLKDEFPEVTWASKPEIKSWDKIDLAYQAYDDIALDDAFITVNGKEVEYAGTPKGLQNYQYQWEFNPKDHLNLNGGDLKLQITVYDQDSINGPKLSQSNTLIWPFPGLEEQTKRSLSALEKVNSNYQKRKEDLRYQPTKPNPSILKNMEQLNQELSFHPAIPEEFQELMQEIMQRQKHHLQKSKGKNHPSIIEEEKKFIQSQQLYLSAIDESLKSILSTIQTARLIAQIKKMMEQLDLGRSVEPDTFGKLFDDLNDYFDQQKFPHRYRAHLLNQLDKAQLASTFGEYEESKEYLKNISDLLRNVHQQQASDNQLSKAFKKMLQHLVELIQKQQDIQLNFQKYLQGSKANQQQHLRKLFSSFKNESSLLAYQNLITKLKQASQQQNSAFQQKELLDKLSNQKSIEYEGRELYRLLHRLKKFTSQVQDKKQMNLPPNLNSFKVSEQSKRHYLDFMKSAFPESKLKGFQRQESKLSQSGQSFAKDFRAKFALLLKSKLPFTLADQAALYSQQASYQILPTKSIALQNMKKALNHWKTLYRILQQMLSQNSSKFSKQQSMLRINEDGEVEFAKRESGSGGEEEGGQNSKDLEIALPEEFQQSKNIEKRLKKELEETQSKQLKQFFQNYMIQLLE